MKIRKGMLMRMRRRTRASVVKRYTRRTYRRIRNKLLSYKNPNKQEVKHKTINQVDGSFPVTNQFYGTAATTIRNSTSWGNNNQFTKGLLSNIAQGTANDQRIGNTIFVKKINYRILLNICPLLTDTAFLNSIAVRVIVTNTNTYFGGSDVNGFFEIPCRTPIIVRADRGNFNIYYDKIIPMNSNVSTLGNARSGSGMIKYLNFNVPVNRQVEYNSIVSPQTQSNVKKDRDIFTLHLFAWSHLYNDQVQVACAQISARIYYTDD